MMTIKELLIKATRYPTSPVLYIYQDNVVDADGEGSCTSTYRPPCIIATYEQFWDVTGRHKEWLMEQIDSVLLECFPNDVTHGSGADSVTDSVGRAAGSVGNQAPNDIIIAYLSENSPDLLMNLLGCMDLTENHHSNANRCVLPAMMNVRWTPLEIARVLSPKSKTDDTRLNHSRGTDQNAVNNMFPSSMHVTVILYGEGYEQAAAEAISYLRNTVRDRTEESITVTNGTTIQQCHHAVAIPIPDFTKKFGRKSNPSKARTLGLKTNNDSSKIEYAHHLPVHSSISNEESILLFTSGTSSSLGIPKGVRLSHRSLFVQALAKTQSPCFYGKETVLTANTVSLFHIGGLSSLLAVILGGGRLLFSSRGSDGGTSSKGFQPEMVIASIKASLTSDVQGANTLVVVPAMLHSIFESIEHDNTSQIFPYVRLILVGGQSIGNGSLYTQTRQHFPNARIVQTYACTEAGSSITFEDLGVNDESETKLKPEDAVIDGAICVGHPPPHIQIGIFEAFTQAPKSQSQQLPRGEMGIIGTRGPHVMLGYWNRGESSSSKSQLVQGGWMFTSDLGYLCAKSGKLFFCGRANDVIRTGGESVLATEVEQVIGMHSEILECAVFALADEKFGESVSAAVVSKAFVPQDGVELMESDELRGEMRRHCANHQLAGFKRPRRVFCMKSLPRNSSGKVLKQQIARLCSQQANLIRCRL